MTSLSLAARCRQRQQTGFLSPGFSETAGGAFLTGSAQAAFLQRILASAAHAVPQVPKSQLVLTGAKDIRRGFEEDTIPSIARAYMDDLKVAFALIVASAGVALVASLRSRWGKMKKADADPGDKA
ncbi:hypothetical protein B0J13DRAFT_646831 [Dactylonectria estremocensis]|uniref:Uncharacterized protein n=1 Tax=Dactylonectria estremocensis TaxID=1079267 RepID=A0A9P9ILK8_9HYPO|nr:hypothetical protein B0J13DRAFT_646831 [Dactylonectria estremocensis]